MAASDSPSSASGAHHHHTSSSSSSTSSTHPTTLANPSATTVRGALDSLTSPTASHSELLFATRKLKNLVIGNKSHKLHVVHYPGAVARLCQLAIDHASQDNPVQSPPADLRIQAAVVLGSLASASANEDSADALVALGVPKALIVCLQDEHEPRVVEAAARGLKGVYSGALRAGKSDLYSESAIRNLVRLVLAGCSSSIAPAHSPPIDVFNVPSSSSSSSSSSASPPPQKTWTAPPATARRIAECAAQILARSCDSPQQQQLAAGCGALSAALRLFVDAACPTGGILGFGGYARESSSSGGDGGAATKTVAAAMDLVGALCRENRVLAQEVARAHTIHGPVLAMILRQLAETDPDVRLATATAVTHLYRAQVLASDRTEEITRTLVPALLRLLTPEHSPSIQERACLTFATLVSDAEALQKLAAESDGMPRLVAVTKLSLSDPAPASTASATSASAGTGADRPPVPGVPLPTSTYAKSGRYSSTLARTGEAALLALAAGCAQCEPARKAAVDAGVMAPIVSALKHVRTGVRAAACQATRSISRSVKSVRTAVLDAGVAEPLVNLLDDTEPAVLLAATAAICNLVLDFSPMKQTVMEKGGVGKLAHLLLSTDSGIRHNAIWALKNLAYNAPTSSKSAIVQAVGWQVLRALVEHDTSLAVQEQALNLVRNLACGHDDDVQVVFAGYGQSALLSVLADKMSGGNPDLVYQAVYALVNIATGSEEHKEAVMANNKVMELLFELMDHPRANIRAGCVWTLINLTWVDDAHPEHRVRRLQQMGFERRLVTMRNDPDADVRDRVSAALSQFQLD